MKFVVITPAISNHYYRQISNWCMWRKM